MANKIYRQGKDKVAQAHRGLRDLYNSFFQFQKNPHPFQVFHGVDAPTAWSILRLGAIDEFKVPVYPDNYLPDGDTRDRAISDILRAAKYYPFRRASGGRRSAKTQTCIYTLLRLSTDFENNLGIVMRANWKNVEITLEAEMKEMLNRVTDGHPEYLVRLNAKKSPIFRHIGYHEMTVFTRGQPSKVLLFPEPEEANERALADAVKSPEGGAGWFYIDEESETHEITGSTLQDNLSRPNVLHAGISSTNPFYEGSWGYRQNREMENAVEVGDEPKILVVRSSMLENPFLEPGYIQRQKHKYKDSPGEWASLIEGRDIVKPDGVPVFRKEFRFDTHVNESLKVNPLLPLYVGVDWGYHHPGAWFCQRTEAGHWNVMGELLGEDWTLPVFAEEIFAYLNRHYPHHFYDGDNPDRSNRNVHFWADPAGSYQNERGNTTIEEFTDMGIFCEYREDSRFPGKRVDIIKTMLNTNIEGRPKLQFHPRCTMILQGMQGGFYYRVSKSGHIGEVPDKTGFLHNLLDAAGYLFWGEVGPRASGAKKRRSTMTVAKGPTRKGMR